MLEILITQNTVMKPGIEQSSLYDPEDLHPVTQDAKFPISVYGMDRGHFLIELRTPIKGFTRWYVFQNHARILSSGQPLQISTPSNNKGRVIKKPKEIILPVRFKAQYDNAYQPNSSCFLTSVAMILDYHGVRPKNPNQQLEDELYLYMVNRGMHRLDGNQIAEVVRVYGFDATYTTTASFTDIKKELDAERPCTIGGYFTHNGHIICLIGYSDAKTDFLAHDPWGRALRGGGYDFSHTGEAIWYDYNHIAEECSPESKSNPRHCWCLFIRPRK